MPTKSSLPAIPLPRGWPSRVKSAILHVISLAQFTMAYTRGWAANSPNSRIRLKAELDRAHQQIALWREEVRIKDVRMGRIDPHRRPHYPATERMAILGVPDVPRPTPDWRRRGSLVDNVCFVNRGCLASHRT